MEQSRSNLAKIYSKVCLEFISVSEAKDFIRCFPDDGMLPLLVKLEFLGTDHLMNFYTENISKIFKEAYDGRFYKLLTAIWKDLISIKRLNILPQIAYEIRMLIIKLEGSISIEFKSAKILKQKDKVNIKNTLKKYLKSDLEILWTNDSSILSGYQIIFGDWKLNSSGAHYLNQLRNKLIGI